MSGYAGEHGGGGSAVAVKTARVFIRTKSEELVSQVYKMAVGTPQQAVVDKRVVLAEMTTTAIAALRRSKDFEVYDDIQFQPVQNRWWVPRPSPAGGGPPPPWQRKTQDDVMKHINAPAAWASQAPSAGNPWDDAVGHGSMCSAIACGSKSDGGRYDGVAPEATLLSARTDFTAYDLYPIYDDLRERKIKKEFEKGLVVSNSYALYVCKAPPDLEKDHPFIEIIRDGVRNGIVFVFAAGNNHALGLCRFPEGDDAPNTIWSVNSIDEVITVGTVDWNNSNQRVGSEHANSSRGPGAMVCAPRQTRRSGPDVWRGRTRRARRDEAESERVEAQGDELRANEEGRGEAAAKSRRALASSGAGRRRGGRAVRQRPSRRRAALGATAGGRTARTDPATDGRARSRSRGAARGSTA